MKKTLSLILTLIMVMGIFTTIPVSANASGVDYLTFEFNEYDNSYSVQKCDTSAQDRVVIPDTYEGLPITTIYPEAFSNCVNITSIQIPETVTWMGVSAFEGCSSLVSINIPDGVDRICDATFNFCRSLSSIELPDTLESIGIAAFQGCSSLAAIEIPDSVTSIGDAAFWSCSSLKTITIPDNAVVGVYPFRYCYGLKSINVGENNTSCSSVNGVLFNKEKTVLLQYPAGKSVSSYIIPNGVKSIDDSAFYSCLNLESIKFPDSVTSVKQMAFFSCTKLKSLKLGKGVKSIADQAFGTCINLESIYIPKSVTEIADGVFLFCNNLKEINVDDENASFTSVNDILFNKRKTVLVQYPVGKTNKSYSIPSGVKLIRMAAFVGCESLEKIIIPDSVTSIYEGAFLLCNNLKSVSIPDSVTKVGELAFGYSASDTGSMEKVKGFTIYGKYCSEAEKYADENGFTFVGPNTFRNIKPNIKSASNNGKYVKVSWEKVKGADYYYVYRKESGGSYSYIGKTQKTYYTDTTAKSGKTYTYKLRAKNAAGYSAYSSTKTVKHLDQPTLKKATNTASGVKITWGEVSKSSGYKVYRKTSDGWKYLGKTSKTYFTDKTAKSGKKYTYSVKAYNGDYNSSFSSTGISKLYLADPILNTPSSTTKGVGLSWSKVTGASGYMVYRRTSNGSYKRITTEKGVSNVTYRDTTAKKGTKYYYKVKAYYSKTYGAYSNTKTITDKY